MDIEQHRSFEYKPIQAGEFRVLEVCCSQDASAEVHCRLVPEHRPGLEPYDALSYTWGTEIPSKPILLNDSEFMVRENLYHALRRLRRTTKDRRIWIDALCIDQSNIDERNSQVAQMRDVFANAREVPIWLGEDPRGHRQYAFEQIPQFTASLSLPGWTLSQEGLRKFLNDEEFLKTLDCISWVFELPWWRRVWVIQEVAVAKKDPTVCAGSKSIGWSALVAFYFAAHNSGLYSIEYDNGISGLARFSLARLRGGVSHLISICRLREIYLKGYQQPLGVLLKDGSRYDSTDPRDRVFALLGLIKGPPPLQVDYHQSQHWVNVSTMTQLLLADQDLRSFSRIIGEIDEQKDPTLPSWVADFCTGRGIYSKIDLAYLPISTDGGAIWEEDRRLYSAVGVHYARITPRFENEGHVVALRGLQVDSIKRLGVCSPGIPFIDSDLHPTHLTPTIADWRKVARLPAEHHNDEQQFMFWRTILVDHNDSGCRRKTGGQARAKPGPHFGKKFMVTSNGSMGLAPGQASIGDEVCAFLGGEVPYIIRPLGEGYYKLIGECYVHGIMDGEAIEDQKTGRFSFEDFRLR